MLSSCPPTYTKALAQALKDNQSVRHFNIGENGIEDEGCMYFGEMLRDNNVLLDLDLSNVRMGPTAALVIADNLGKAVQVDISLTPR